MFWFVAAAGWLIIAALNRFEVLYLAASGLSVLAGGTTLFRLYETPDARAAQDRLARHRVWSRVFPWSDRLLRLGLPGPEAEWHRLAAALSP